MLEVFLGEFSFLSDVFNNCFEPPYLTLKQFVFSLFIINPLLKGFFLVSKLIIQVFDFFFLGLKLCKLSAEMVELFSCPLMFPDFFIELLTFEGQLPVELLDRVLQNVIISNPSLDLFFEVDTLFGLRRQPLLQLFDIPIQRTCLPLVLFFQLLEFKLFLLEVCSKFLQYLFLLDKDLLDLLAVVPSARFNSL